VDVLKDEQNEPKKEEEEDDESDGSGDGNDSEEGGSETEEPKKKTEDGTEDESDVEEPTKPTGDNPHEDEDNEGTKSNTSSKSSSHRSSHTPKAEEDAVFQDANEEEGRISNTSGNSQSIRNQTNQDENEEEGRSNTSGNSQSIKNKKSPLKSPSVDVLKKKFEDEGTSQAMDIFNTPKSGVAREKPTRVLVTPLGATLVYKNSTQQSIEKYVTDTNKKKTKPKAKTSQMPTLKRTRANLLGAPPVRNSLSPKMD
jgi:hypothetical protein